MSADTLIAFLRQQANRPGGMARVPAGRVLEGLGISRPTLMRAVQGAGEQVIAMGQTRRRRSKCLLATQQPGRTHRRRLSGRVRPQRRRP